MKILARQHEITNDYLKEIDKHLLDIVENRTDQMFEIRDFASILHIHPTHLTNTVKQTTGKHPCFFFEEKLLVIAKRMLADNKMSIAEIAMQLTYDPSNFTKWFKRYAGTTPKRYREDVLREKTETVTI
ncbi:MAG: AraC family transcriptional regulator [Pirellulales bacterium]